MSETKPTLKQFMSTELTLLPHDVTASDAARKMRDADVGNVLVTRDGGIHGIVTDRDLVVRCLADGKDPAKISLDELCSKELVMLSPESEANEAVKLMREKAIRRIPVVEGKKPVGIVSLGDLAERLDGASALGAISSAPATR